MIYKINGKTVTREEYLAHQVPGSDLQELIATRGRGLRLNSDTAWMARKRAQFGYSLENQIKDPRERELFIKNAKRAGVPQDVFYDPGLADKKHDPAAMFTQDGCMAAQSAQRDKIVGPTDGRPPPPPCPLHPRLVRQQIASLIKEDPALATKPKRELAERVIAEHGQKV